MSAVSRRAARLAYEAAKEAEALFEELRPQLEYMSKGTKRPRKLLPVAASSLYAAIKAALHHTDNLHCFEEDRATGEVDRDGHTKLELCLQDLDETSKVREAERQRQASPQPCKVIQLFPRPERGPFAKPEGSL